MISQGRLKSVFRANVNNAFPGCSLHSPKKEDEDNKSRKVNKKKDVT